MVRCFAFILGPGRYDSTTRIYVFTVPSFFWFYLILESNCKSQVTAGSSWIGQSACHWTCANLSKTYHSSPAPPAAYTNELAGISGLVLVPDELEAQSLMPERFSSVVISCGAKGAAVHESGKWTHVPHRYNGFCRCILCNPHDQALPGIIAFWIFWICLPSGFRKHPISLCHARNWAFAIAWLISARSLAFYLLVYVAFRDIIK